MVVRWWQSAMLDDCIWMTILLMSQVQWFTICHLSTNPSPLLPQVSLPDRRWNLTGSSLIVYPPESLRFCSSLLSQIGYLRYCSVVCLSAPASLSIFFWSPINTQNYCCWLATFVVAPLWWKTLETVCENPEDQQKHCLQSKSLRSYLSSFGCLVRIGTEAFGHVSRCLINQEHVEGVKMYDCIALDFPLPSRPFLHLFFSKLRVTFLL